eukprot:CAMPEP_0118934840 /NCGR_PEP_ID=MMETSP1169-20130426/14264_1 /TAXON_ID=36882 /ORGANISM="Pyramimonas obovata, Strain CCMP722" /LENGTH=91 /DNA_ID=CAMNT_0006877783 /DNA_START=125 /DNA_END=400 /DNA_ORIENTATION=+
MDNASERMQFCINEAMKAGAVTSLQYAAVSVPSVYLANKYVTAFRTRLGISGKTAIAFSPFVLGFWLSGELTLNKCSTRRNEYAEAMQKVE